MSTQSSSQSSSTSGTEPRDLMTVEQAAQYLHISASSIHACVNGIRSYIREKLEAFHIAVIRKVL